MLHIVNAPKAGPPMFIAYTDVCYSSTESRPSKMYLQHISQWNMLLVSSANSIDVSLLRISQLGDLPVWTQEFPSDMFPAELPLTPNKDESFPAGFALETGCVGRLAKEDNAPYPAMPMIHVLSTYGVLCSFYVLNTTSNYVDICSPPRPIDPAVSSLFRAQQITAAPAPEPAKTPPKADIPFSIPMGQSTPAVPKVQPMPAKVPAVNVFNTSQPPPAFVQPPSLASAFQTVAKTTAPPTAPTLNLTQSKPPTALITVPPTYTPSTEANSKADGAARPAVVEKQNTAEDELIYNRMIQDEVKAFELELRTVMEKSRSLRVNIGTKDESAEMRRSIEELDELKKEATETIESLRTDVQSNRLGLTEMFSMVYEARAKFEQEKNEKSIFINQNQLQDRSSKRTIDRLVKQVSHCEMQLQTAIQAMNEQWASYHEAMNKYKKNRMHNPSLEVLYQTLTKQQEIIYRQCEKMAQLKSKLGLRDSFMKQKTSADSPAVESFSDLMISISLADQVEAEKAKLTNKKLKTLRNLLIGREVVTITTQRAERAGLNSEIIREKKLQTLKSMKKRQLDDAPAGFAQTSTPPAFNSTPPLTAFNMNAAQQKPPNFGLVSSQPSFGIAKASNEPPKVPFMGFGGPPTPSTPSFGLNLSNTSNQPSFDLSSSPLVLEAEKKKKEQAPRLYFSPAAHKTTTEAPKPPSTIANTNIAVTASFSIPLANKVAPSAVKEPPRVVEKKQDENKAPTNENASFTFKIAEKKDESSVVTIKAPTGTPNFASLLSSSTADSSKGFSFAAGTTASPFTAAPKTTTSAVAATPPASIFSGFGGAPAAVTTASIFGGTTSFSGFGSSFSLGLGSDQTKPANTGFSLNLSSTSETTKTTPSAGTFSFASAASSIPSTAIETKPANVGATAKPPSSTSTFSFASAIAQPTAAKPSEGVDVAPATST